MPFPKIPLRKNKGDAKDDVTGKGESRGVLSFWPSRGRMNASAQNENPPPHGKSPNGRTTSDCPKSSEAKENQEQSVRAEAKQENDVTEKQRGRKKMARPNLRNLAQFWPRVLKSDKPGKKQKPRKNKTAAQKDSTAPSTGVKEAPFEQQSEREMDAAVNSGAQHPKLDNAAAYNKIAARPKNRKANKRTRRPASTGQDVGDIDFWTSGNDVFENSETKAIGSQKEKTSPEIKKKPSKVIERETQPDEQEKTPSVKKAHSFKGPSVLPSLTDMKQIKLRKTPSNEKTMFLAAKEKDPGSPKPLAVAPSPKPRWKRPSTSDTSNSSKSQMEKEAPATNENKEKRSDSTTTTKAPKENSQQEAEKEPVENQESASSPTQVTKQTSLSESSDEKVETPTKQGVFKPNWLNVSPDKEATPTSPKLSGKVDSKKSSPIETEVTEEVSPSKPEFLAVLEMKKLKRNSSSDLEEKVKPKKEIEEVSVKQEPQDEKVNENPFHKLKKVNSGAKDNVTSPKSPTVPQVQLKPPSDKPRPKSIAIIEKDHDEQEKKAIQVKRNKSDKQPRSYGEDIKALSHNDAGSESMPFAVKLRKTGKINRAEEGKIEVNNNENVDGKLSVKKPDVSESEKNKEPSAISPRKKTASWTTPKQLEVTSPTKENVKPVTEEKPTPKWKKTKDPERKENGKPLSSDFISAKQNKVHPKSPTKPSGFVSGKGSSFNRNNSNGSTKVEAVSATPTEEKAPVKRASSESIHIMEVTSPILKHKDSEKSSRRTSTTSKTSMSDQTENINPAQGNKASTDKASKSSFKEKKTEDSQTSTAPDWVSLARRRSQKWENIMTTTKEIKQDQDDKKEKSTPSSQTTPVTTSALVIQETLPNTAEPSSIKTSKSVEEKQSVMKKSKIATRSVSSDLPTRPSEVLRTTSCKGETSDVESMQSSPPPWLAIAMEKQKRWVREETV